MTLTLGWWALPLIITFALFVWALVPRANERKHGDFDFGFWIPGAFRLAAAIIVSLIVWLIWSLLS